MGSSCELRINTEPIEKINKKIKNKTKIKTLGKKKNQKNLETICK